VWDEDFCHLFQKNWWIQHSPPWMQLSPILKRHLSHEKMAENGTEAIFVNGNEVLSNLKII